MKSRKTVAVLLSLLMITVALLPLLSSCGNSKKKITLYVYNWGEYISDGSEDSVETNAEFEAYCRDTLGIDVEVNYSTFSSNEDMYAKISSGSAVYDVIIPSDYMIQRMVEESLLQPLNIEKIPNYEYVRDEFKGDNVYYEDDSDNIYSVPYFYGMIGVIYNTSIVAEDNENIGSWDLLWDARHTGDILQYNNSRDAFGTALYKLGYDVNEATEEQWREALALLTEQKQYVQGYVMDEIFNKMQGGAAAVSTYYAGDFLSMYENNDQLAFFYPKEGTNVYIDAMCIPANAQHVDLAHEYINFMCSEDIAVANAEATYYASPLSTVLENEEYQECMAEVHENAMDILYGEEASSVPTQAYLNLTPERLTLLNDLWEELKVESSIGLEIYILCGIILAALVILIIAKMVKKHRWSKLYD